MVKDQGSTYSFIHQHTQTLRQGGWRDLNSNPFSYETTHSTTCTTVTLPKLIIHHQIGSEQFCAQRVYHRTIDLLACH